MSCVLPRDHILPLALEAVSLLHTYIADQVHLLVVAACVVQLCIELGSCAAGISHAGCPAGELTGWGWVTAHEGLLLIRVFPSAQISQASQDLLGQPRYRKGQHHVRECVLSCARPTSLRRGWSCSWYFNNGTLIASMSHIAVLQDLSGYSVDRHRPSTSS